MAAGFLGLGGINYGINNQSPFFGILGATAGLGICLKSKSMDEKRQLRQKQELLNTSQNTFVEQEQLLQEAANLYRVEELNLWLLYALRINQHEFRELEEWCSDPRRDMKDDVLQAIALLNEYLNLPVPSGQATYLLQTSYKYYDLRNQLLSAELQEEKAQFIQQISTSHSAILTQQEIEANLISAVKIGGASVVGGTTAGLIAGVGAAALSAGAVKALGGSKEAENVAAVVGGAAAVIGVGILAAKAFGSWLGSREEEKKQLQEQYFRDAFNITGQILKLVKWACQTRDLSKRQSYLMSALNVIQAFQAKELTTQDQTMKDYVSILRWQITTYFNNYSIAE